jgi:hypothetical protein
VREDEAGRTDERGTLAAVDRSLYEAAAGEVPRQRAPAARVADLIVGGVRIEMEMERRG